MISIIIAILLAAAPLSGGFGRFGGSSRGRI